MWGMTALRKGGNLGTSLSRLNPGRLAGASGTTTIAQLVFGGFNCSK
jgi:hypothetical protein